MIEIRVETGKRNHQQLELINFSAIIDFRIFNFR